MLAVGSPSPRFAARLEVDECVLLLDQNHRLDGIVSVAIVGIADTSLYKRSSIALLQLQLKQRVAHNIRKHRKAREVSGDQHLCVRARYSRLTQGLMRASRTATSQTAWVMMPAASIKKESGSADNSNI